MCVHYSVEYVNNEAETSSPYSIAIQVIRSNLKMFKDFFPMIRDGRGMFVKHYGYWDVWVKLYGRVFFYFDLSSNNTHKDPLVTEKRV